jgi:hypothetical protein
VDRGPGTLPVTLDAEATELGTTRVEKLGNEDMSHAALGDRLGTTRGTHDVDRSAFTGPRAAGAIGSTGAGGEAVWRSQLTPEEQRVVERYFK